MEHQPMGLLWNIDNTLITTYGGSYQYKDGKIERSSRTAGHGAQWGLTQSVDGKLWCFAGNERGTMYFQQPQHYGLIELEGEKTQDDFYKVWPLVQVPDVQGGPYRVRENNTLNHFTGTAGVEVYRGEILGDSE